jgi:UDP-N-acetylmuramoyl-L-alanyl-D-glutamate--2,6-diaminopimelate ligase
MFIKKLIRKFVPQKYKNYIHFFQSLFAVIYYRYPAKNLEVIGVTGTDGKTTTATLVYHFLKTAGKKTALVTSVAAYIGDKEIDTGFHVTNPDPWPLQKLLRKVADQKLEYVVLEVTSHGLDQYRTLGTNIKTAVLTNITHEHTDYHKTYDSYLMTKAKIFKNAKVAIINKKDKSYLTVKKYIDKNKTDIISYDLNSLPKNIMSEINSRFVETFNQFNATAACLVAREVGIENNQIIKAIRTFKGVPGRMQEVKNKKEIRIVIDFAHTPNALVSALTALQKQLVKDQKLIAIFGCASERDVKKRPMMAKNSTKLADISIFTAEDPRNEDIKKIFSEMSAGITETPVVKVETDNFVVLKQRNNKKHYYLEIPERGEAISFVIQKIANKGDIVAIFGKGHEKSMNYNGTEYSWSDEKAVKYALKGKTLRIKS